MKTVEIFHNVTAAFNAASSEAVGYLPDHAVVKTFEFTTDTDFPAADAFDLSRGHPRDGQELLALDYSNRGLRPIQLGDLLRIDGCWLACAHDGWEQLQAAPTDVTRAFMAIAGTCPWPRSNSAGTAA